MRRVVWGVFVAFLVALGAFVHAVAEPVPTWSVIAPGGTVPAFEQILADRAFFTVRKVEVWPVGPFTARDSRTGEVLYARDESDKPHPLGTPVVSANGRRGLATLSGERTLLWLDRDEARRLTFDTVKQASLSPDGDWLLVEERDDQQPVEEPSRLHILRWGGESRTLRASRMGALSWSPDGAFFTFHDGGGAVLYDPARRRGLARIPVGVIYGLSPDGKTLWASRGSDCELWRLDDPLNPRRMGTVPGEGHAFPTFAPDGGLWFLPHAETEEEAQTGRVHVRDARSGVKRWEIPLTERGFWNVQFSANGRFAAVSPTPWRVTWSDQVRQSLLDTRDGREVKQWTVGTLWEMAPDGVAVHVHENRGAPGHGTVEVQRTDGSTSILTVLRYDRLSMSRFSDGRPRLWLHGQRPLSAEPEGWLRWLRYLQPTPAADAGLLLALDWPSGRTAFRLARPGLSGYVAADDGSYVLTFQTFSDHTLLCRWDVPVRKPWFWVITIPLLIGVSLLGLRAAWTRYRTPTAEPNRSRDPAT